jgi:putative ABC transport system substrate-binding protein
MTSTVTRLAAALLLLAAALSAEAQPGGKVYRIGYLASTEFTVASREPFLQGLRELGWVEGRNIVIDYRFADRYDRLPDLAADLVRLKVDIIVATGTPAAAAAKKATGTIPIVMIGPSDPVGTGLIASLARPGGNVTGLTYDVGLGAMGKQLELLKETVPKVRLVAILSNPAHPVQPLMIREAKAVAGSLGVQLQLLEAREPNQFDSAFAVMAKKRVDALHVLADGMFILHRARLADLAARNRLPSMHTIRLNVEAGGLMSYAVSFSDLMRRAATFVDKIIKGARPADLPVEQPTKFELVINLRTAKMLGLTIPPSVLLRADHIIE